MHKQLTLRSHESTTSITSFSQCETLLPSIEMQEEDASPNETTGHLFLRKICVVPDDAHIAPTKCNKRTCKKTLRVHFSDSRWGESSCSGCFHREDAPPLKPHNRRSRGSVVRGEDNLLPPPGRSSEAFPQKGVSPRFLNGTWDCYLVGVQNRTNQTLHMITAALKDSFVIEISRFRISTLSIVLVVYAKSELGMFGNVIDSPASRSTSLQLMVTPIATEMEKSIIAFSLVVPVSYYKW